MPEPLSYLDVVIAVHDTGKQAPPKLLYHVLQGLALSVPGCHDTVLCGGYAHGHRLPIIQLKLHGSSDRQACSAACCIESMT